MKSTKIQEILALVLLLNEKSKLAVWFTLSGHVQWLCVKVAEDKEDHFLNFLYEANDSRAFYKDENYISLDNPEGLEAELNTIISELEKLKEEYINVNETK